MTAGLTDQEPTGGQQSFGAAPTDLLCLIRRVTRDLPDEPDLETLVQTIVRTHRLPLGLAGAVVGRRHDNALELVASAACDEQAVSLETIPLLHRTPLAEAARTGFEVVVDRPDADLLRPGAHVPCMSLVALPLRHGRDTVGAAEFCFSTAIVVDGTLIDHLWILAQLCTTTLLKADDVDPLSARHAGGARVVLLPTTPDVAAIGERTRADDEPMEEAPVSGQFVEMARRVEQLEAEVRDTRRVLHFLSEILNERFGHR